MNAHRLADHIRRALTGPMWHGPSLEHVLANTSAEMAASRPVQDAHSIWELVLHMTAWAEIARARLHGERVEYPAEEVDWPAPGAATPEAWAAALRALRSSYTELAEEVERLTPEQLDAPVAGQNHPTWAMLNGVVEHACYHGGQIPILRRASPTEDS